MVNVLLEGCFDNKFEIRFQTQRPKANGRGIVDDFDVEVRNKNPDRTYLVDELSGGGRQKEGMFEILKKSWGEVAEIPM